MTIKELLKDGLDGVGWAIPLTLVLIGEVLQAPIIGLVVGHRFSEDAWNGFNLANLTGNLIGMSIITGMQGAMDTLMPISLGAGRLREMGEVAQLGFVMSLLSLAVFIPVWVKAEDLLIAIGQPRATCHYAGEYLSIAWIAVLGNLIFEAMRRFMNAQDVLWPFVFFRYFGVAVQAFLVELFTGHLQMGFVSAAYAQVIGMGVCVFSCGIWLVCFKPYKEGTWEGWSMKAFEWERVKQYTKLGMAGLFACSEWWYWEILAFMSGWMGSDEQSAHSCAYLILPIAYVASVGIGASMNYKMGQRLGRGDVAGAKKLCIRVLAFSFCLSIVLAVVQYVIKEPIMDTVKSSNPNIRSLINKIWPWVALSILIDTNLALLGNVIKALGLQVRQAYLVTITLWCIMLPLQYVVDFKLNGGLPWMWRMFPMGEFVMTVGTTILCFTKDWNTLDVIADVGIIDEDGEGSVGGGATGTAVKPPTPIIIDSPTEGDSESESASYEGGFITRHEIATREHQRLLNE